MFRRKLADDSSCIIQTLYYGIINFCDKIKDFSYPTKNSLSLLWKYNIESVIVI